MIWTPIQIQGSALAQIGVAALVGFGILCVVTILNVYLGKLVGRAKAGDRWLFCACDDGVNANAFHTPDHAGKDAEAH